MIEVSTLNNKTIISIDNDSIPKEDILYLVKRMEYEQSINKANFKDDVLELSEKIQTEWWEANKNEYMSGTGIDL
ncbi:MAG TPA: hypothetical protein PKY56_11610 [Candidatus Kapabacteria bacterium]|nr:hypothetical protein [Candidatus Kapabacteria bacterium]HPO61947.1 hypothetical protein [Candidatus Kapabacteria bacterium]